MRRLGLWLACPMLFSAGALGTASGTGPEALDRHAHERERAGAASATLRGPQIAVPASGAQQRITVRAAMLSDRLGLFAGYPVRVPGVRVVGMFGPRVLVVEAATRRRPIAGYRNRIAVFIQDGAMQVPDTLLVGSTVEVVGVARTMLGLQVTGEVPWPAELDPGRIARLDIRAAVLASSVRTAEGIELTDRLEVGPGGR